MSALVFKDRAFCRGFCPVGLLLGTYGRGGMLAVRAGSGAACESCAGRDCVVACNRARLEARSCPSLLNPPKLNSNEDCLVCGQCIKVCRPDNMRLLLRKPFAASDAREAAASWPVTLFVMLASGFVIWELFTEWPAAEERFLAVLEWIGAQLGWSAGWLHGVWSLAVVPLAVWTILAGAVRLSGRKERLADSWRRLALPMAVLIAAGHMSKGLAKFVSWAPFLPHAFRDPDGAGTVQAISAKTLSSPSAWLSLSAVSLVCLALIAAALCFAVREQRLAHPEGSSWLRPVLPLAIVALAFAIIVAGWG